MSRLRVAKGLVLTAVVMYSLAAGASAWAAAWQGPVPISATTVNASGAKIALGTGGDAGAVWWDDSNGGRLVLARKQAGAAWSAPVTAVPIAMAVPAFIGVDGTGTITAVYSNGTDTIVTTWVATAAAPVSSTLFAGNLSLGGVAVGPTGDAVVAGWSGSPAQLTVAYRRGAGGAFTLKTYPYPSGIAFSVQSASVAINSTGTAVVVLQAGGLRAVTHTATADWPEVPDAIETFLTVNDGPAVGIDQDGDVIAAFTYTAGGAGILRTAVRPAGATGWLESGDLSPATAGASATSLNVAVARNGPAAVVWLQGSSAGTSVKARYGFKPTAGFGPIDDVSDPGAMSPVAAIDDAGNVVAAWELSTTGNIGQARVRAFDTGLWGLPRTLTPTHANATLPSLASDPLGDFATVSTPYDGTYHPVDLSYYDAAAPRLTTEVTGNQSIGGVVTFTVNPTDAWSTLGVPVWTFGDGPPGSGLSVTHTFSATGTQKAQVSVTDGAGNTSTADLVFDIQRNATAAIGSARFTARWKRSRVSGSLVIAGTTPVAGSYTLDVTRSKTRRIHTVLNLPGGPFSRTLKLPASLLPGSYTVALVPAAQLKNVVGSARVAKLAAPAEGVVDVAALSRTRTGKAARTLSGATALWARFHFAAVPKGKQLSLTWYRTVKGKRVNLRTVSRKPASSVRDSLAVRGVHGTITVVLARAGKVIFQNAVRLK
jgi:hypothetical protein